MKTLSVVILCLSLVFGAQADAKETYETDFIETAGGGLMITFVGHGTLMFLYKTTWC